MSELGDRIRRARQHRKITGAQLATSIGVSATYISELERGVKKNPSMQVIAGMAEVMSYPIDYFFGVEEKKLRDYIPDDLSGYVRERIVAKYCAEQRDLHELDDAEMMGALVEYLRAMKNRSEG
ncbi:helix-turn-helix domain-containing protein [Tumebacillus lipolyticus]|uniref:Helix-turn-helix domain-containing protein n=1 Tax=Tumebacillus lipolyticus TaxID=1280370 RepID=A0ABW4ZZZ2_9BACL